MEVFCRYINTVLACLVVRNQTGLQSIKFSTTLKLEHTRKADIYASVSSQNYK